MALDIHKYYSNGKLLLTGEYVVLDGALSLALPSTYGQYLSVTKTESKKMTWESRDDYNSTWFKTTLNADVLKTLNTDADTTTIVESSSNKEIVKTLLKILAAAKSLNPSFLNDDGYEITTTLTFPRNWGLGSSSTLINNIARWANIDAYQLLWKSFPGSGYDIACAQQQQPVLYRVNNKKPVVKPVEFYPPFADQLYFVHLNKKQNSREGIQRYQNRKENKVDVINTISDITKKITATKTLNDFETLITEHETLIAGLLQLPKIKDRLFSDYFGTIKSLGAWGGDFILATGNKETLSYFKTKGFSTVIPYDQMVIKNNHL